MNDFLRTAFYGAQHKIEIINQAPTTKDYVVVDHNRESGDIFTPAPGNPEEITTRTLQEAQNAFPDAGEYMVD